MAGRAGEAVADRRRWDRVVTIRPKRMAAAQTPRPQPGAAHKTMARDGLGGVVGARRHEPAGTREPGRQHELIRANQGERRAGCHAGNRQVDQWFAAAVIGRRAPRGRRIHARDWDRRHREIRGEGQRRCRGRQLVCGSGTTRGSVAWPGCESPRRQSFVWPQCRVARGRIRIS